MKLFDYLKNKILKFYLKRRSKKILREVEKIQEKRANDFSKVEKDINSFWYIGK